MSIGARIKPTRVKAHAELLHGLRLTKPKQPQPHPNPNPATPQPHPYATPGPAPANFYQLRKLVCRLVLILPRYECPLSGVERKSISGDRMSAFSH